MADRNGENIRVIASRGGLARGSVATPRRTLRDGSSPAPPGHPPPRAPQGGEGVVAKDRSPEMIRASIEETRHELAFSVNDLRSKVAEVTNWRGQLIRNRRTALIGAAVAGFVIGGGIAAGVSLITGRR